MSDLIAACPGVTIHVILDNLNAHEPKNDRWLSSHPNAHSTSDRELILDPRRKTAAPRARDELYRVAHFS